MSEQGKVKPPPGRDIPPPPLDRPYDKSRPGRILSDTIYGAWCDLCDDHLGDSPTYQEASIKLSVHLDDVHPEFFSPK